MENPITEEQKEYRRKRSIEGLQAKYGEDVTNPSQIPSVKKQRREQILARHKAGEFQRALQKKYGKNVVNPSQIPEVRRDRRRRAIEEDWIGQMKDKMEKKYGEGVRNPSQIPSNKERNRETQRRVQSSPKVQKKILRKIAPHIRHLDEYVSLDMAEWAEDFKMKNGVKPAPYDMQKYFNKKAPFVIPWESKKYFNMKEVELERIFQDILEDMGYKVNEDVFRRKRFLKQSSSSSLELDFFFPKKMIAFEIQDFMTHSKDREDEEVFRKSTNKTVLSKLKKGPSYHRHKEELAETYGITLFEIWQDEFDDINRLKTEVSFILMSDELSFRNEFSPWSVSVSEEMKKRNQPLPEMFYDDELLPWWREEI